MSLGKLLTSGKSLVGLHNDESRYEMRPKNLLPKFGSNKNPFRTAKPESLQPQQSEKVQTIARTYTPAEVDAAKLKETKRLPVVTAIRAETPAEERKPGIGAKLGLWSAKIVTYANPMTWFGKKDAPRFSGPRFDKAPVQTELSLDRIKVVRNDLSDADLEVVPVKVVVQPKTEPVVQPAAKAEAAPELIKA